MREFTEKSEGIQAPDTVIYDGDWKLNVHTNNTPTGYGMRRYHHHSNNWYTVKMTDYEGNGWVCNKCNEKTPDAMEGYINLARWALNDN